MSRPSINIITIISVVNMFNLFLMKYYGTLIYLRLFIAGIFLYVDLSKTIYCWYFSVRETTSTWKKHALTILLTEPVNLAVVRRVVKMYFEFPSQNTNL